MAKLEDHDRMPFGKHGGKKMEDVPASYLLWLWDDGWWERHTEPLGAYIADAFTALLKECPDYEPKHHPQQSRS